MSYGPECPKCGNRNRTEVKALFTSTYVYCGLCDSDVAPKPAKAKGPVTIVRRPIAYGSIVLTEDMPGQQKLRAQPSAYVYGSTVRYVLDPSTGKYHNPNSSRYDPDAPYDGDYLAKLGYKPEW